MMLAHIVARQPVEADAYLPAHEHFIAMINHLRSERTKQMTHSAVEEWLETDGCELFRLMFQAHLDERSPGTVAAPVLDADGVRHPHQRLHRR